MERSTSWDEVLSGAQSRWQASTLAPTPWQRSFPRTLARVVDEWQLEPVQIFAIGVSAPVVEVRRPSGESAVLKLGPPDELNHQAAVMIADEGRSHARVLAHDPTAAAMLTELLGAPVGQLVADPLEQYRLIAQTLHRWWQIPLELGADNGSKAQGLLGLLTDQGSVFGGDWPAAVVRASTIAAELSATERVEVVCHGDPHPWNLLSHSADGSWRFVDPDGFRGERAYDLGVVIRGESERVIAMEDQQPGLGAAFLREAAATLAVQTGVDAERIWQWGFVERVTTGLYCRMLGYEDEGRRHLESAEMLAPNV